MLVSHLLAALIVGTTIWLGVDASGRDWSDNRFASATWKWVVGCLFLWIVAFPAYLAMRGNAPRKGAPAPLAAAARDGWTPPTASVAPPSFRHCASCTQPVRDSARDCPFCGQTL
jgi:hypothetical protein